MKGTFTVLIIIIFSFGCARPPKEARLGVTFLSKATPFSFEDFFSFNAEPVVYVHFINVGQANSTLLEFPCGAILIDAGSQNENYSNHLVKYLNEFFERRTDLNRTLNSIIITHNHIDHTRALDNIIQNFNVLTFIENGQRGSPNDPGDRTVKWLIQEVQNGRYNIRIVDIDQSQIVREQGLTNEDIDPIKCTNIDPIITVLSADLNENPGWSEEQFNNKNNHSIVTKVDFGNTSFLFPGDLEEPAIEDLVYHYRNSRLLDVDVYEVGHHGSYNGTTPSLVESMTPELAVISMGRWDDKVRWSAWEYGHPRQGTVDLLKEGIEATRPLKLVHIASGVRRFYAEEMTDAIYATGWDGSIVIRGTAGGSLEVMTEN